MYEHLKAENMKKMAVKYHMENLSDELKDLLDVIYVASRNGKTAIKMDRDIKVNKQDVKVLRLMGYNVTCTFLPSSEEERNGNVEMNLLYVGW